VVAKTAFHGVGDQTTVVGGDFEGGKRTKAIQRQWRETDRFMR